MMDTKEVEVMFDPDEEGEEGEESSLRRRLIKPSQVDLGEILEEELKESKYGKKVGMSCLEWHTRTLTHACTHTHTHTHTHRRHTHSHTHTHTYTSWT